MAWCSLYGGWSKFLYLFFFRESFANSMLIFCGTHVKQQLLLSRFVHHLPSHTILSRITSSSPCKHAAGITESPFQDRLLLIRQFFWKAYWAHSFAELLRNFRENYPYPQTPAISRGRIKGKAKARSLGVWLSQSLTFGSLAAAFGACFLRLQKATLGSTSGRCKEVLQDHGIWLTFGSFIYTMIMIHNIQLSRHFRE